MLSCMSETQKYEDLTKENNPELERLRLLLEKADQIYSDLGDLIGALDLIYIDKKAARLPPPEDFLFPDIKKRHKKTGSN